MLVLIKKFWWGGFVFGLFLLLLGATANARSYTCEQLTGEWQGTYVERSGLYGKPTPWPVTVNFYFDKKTHHFVGEINSPFIPSAVQNHKRIFANKTHAKIIGICRQISFRNVLLFSGKPTCGHYNDFSGWMVDPNNAIWKIDYEFSMIDAKFEILLHKISNKLSGKAPTQNDLAFPKIESCH